MQAASPLICLKRLHGFLFKLRFHRSSAIKIRLSLPEHLSLPSVNRVKRPIPIAAVREVKAKGAKVLALCNVHGSTLVREADNTLFLKAGAEIGVCSTKAFTNQVCCLVAVYLDDGQNASFEQRGGAAVFRKIFSSCLKRCRQFSIRRTCIAKIAKRYSR